MDSEEPLWRSKRMKNKDWAVITWGDVWMALDIYLREKYPDKEFETVSLPRKKYPGYVLFKPLEVEEPNEKEI